LSFQEGRIFKEFAKCFGTHFKLALERPLWRSLATPVHQQVSVLNFWYRFGTDLVFLGSLDGSIKWQEFVPEGSKPVPVCMCVEASLPGSIFWQN
jgi:hypothetical protein